MFFEMIFCNISQAYLKINLYLNIELVFTFKLIFLRNQGHHF